MKRCSLYGRKGRQNFSAAKGENGRARVTGIFFLASAALQAVNLVGTLGSTTQANILLSVAGLALCLAFGVLGLRIPTFITRFTATWDSRVEGSGEAVERLGKLLEGS